MDLFILEKINPSYDFLNITTINESPNTKRLELYLGATKVVNGEVYISNFKRIFKDNQLVVTNDNIEAIIKFLKDNVIACHIKDSKNLCENNLIINYDDLLFNINDAQNYDLFLYELDF